MPFKEERDEGVLLKTVGQIHIVLKTFYPLEESEVIHKIIEDKYEMKRYIEEYLKIYRWDLSVKEICVYECESIHLNIVVATHFTTLLLSSVLFGILEKLAEKVVEYLLDKVLKSERERVHIVEVNIYGSHNVVYASPTASTKDIGGSCCTPYQAPSNKVNISISCLFLILVMLISTVFIILLSGWFSIQAGELPSSVFSQVHQSLVVGIVIGSLLGLFAMLISIESS